MMPLSRNGKIARLPKPLREELNRRLDQDAPGGPLLQWLNSLPQVQAVLAADFGGRPINKQSLSQWRHGGYAEWLRLRETRTLAGQMLAEARELQPAGAPPLTDQMATWVLIRYLMVVRKLIGQTGAEKADFNLLHEFSRDLMAFQRGDHAKARLQFEWTRFKLLSGLQTAPTAPCPEPPKTEAVVTDDQPPVVARIAKSAVGRPSFGSQAAKPACRGLSWRLDRYFPVSHGEASRPIIFPLSNRRFMERAGGRAGFLSTILRFMGRELSPRQSQPQSDPVRPLKF